MASLTDRLKANLMTSLFKEELEQLTDYVSLFENAYRMGRILQPEERTEQRLAEASNPLVNRLMRNRRSLYQRYYITEYDRKLAIDWAWRLTDENTSIDLANGLWTDFGLGQEVTIRASDPSADKVIQEFWGADRNRPVLGIRNQEEISRSAINEGELCFVYWYSPMDGVSTVRMHSTRDLTIIRDPDDRLIRLWYVFTTTKGVFYFPDYAATPEQLNQIEIPNGATRMDEGTENPGVFGMSEQLTHAVVQLAQRRVNRQILRGMPQFTTAFEWAMVLEGFMGDRAAVAKKSAMYTEKVTVKTGSRLMADLTARLRSGLSPTSPGLDSNPAPVAGSDWLQNDKINREWMTRDTGASGARYDGRMLAGQVSAGTRVPLHWSGFPDALANRSTAEETRIPWEFQIKRYRLWLSDVFDEMGRVVLLISEKKSGQAYADKSIDVTLDTPLNVTLEELQETARVVQEGMKDGTIPLELGQPMALDIYRLIFQKVGSADMAQKVSSVLDNITELTLSGAPPQDELMEQFIAILAEATPEVADFINGSLADILRPQLGASL